MENNILSNLIELIYEAAFDVDLWPRLAQLLSNALEPLLVETCSSDPVSPVGNPDTEHIVDQVQPFQTHFCQTDPDSTASSSRLEDPLSKNGLVELLRPHFIRALELNRQIFEARQERNAMQDLFERLPMGMLIVDGCSRVLTQNQKLNQIVSDGKGLLIKGNQLCAMSTANTLQLRKLIREVSEKEDHPGDTIHLYHPEMSLSALVVPFESNGSHNGTEKKRVLILVAAPEMDAEIAPEILMSYYQLTGAEARLVSALIKDHSLNDIAEQFGISKHTIRNQLKAVYEKTGTHRQAELVRRVITGPAMLAALTNKYPSIRVDDNGVSNSVVYTQHNGSRRHQIMRLPDGRRLGFAEYGDPSGRPVMLMHAANGSRLERHPDETIIDRCGIRLIIPERPGVGLSDNRPRLTLFNWGQDVASLADHLDLKKFNIIGYSLGATFALACAYKLKGRVGRVVTVSGMAPFDHIGELEGMYPPFRLVLSLGRYAGTLLEPMVGLFNFHFSSEIYEKDLFRNLPPVDQALVRDINIRDRILENVKENLRRGEHSKLQEAFIVSRHWGFDLCDITIPAEVWHGEQDYLIPPQMGRKLTEKLPNCRSHFLPGAGHYLLFHSWRHILLSAISDVQ